MADHPRPSREHLLDKLAGESDRLADVCSPGRSAEIDQEIATTRQLCLDVGIDLTDPAVAELVLRITHVIGPVVRHALSYQTQQAVVAVTSARPNQAAGAMARWYASGHVALAAAAALKIGQVQQP